MSASLLLMAEHLGKQLKLIAPDTTCLSNTASRTLQELSFHMTLTQADFDAVIQKGTD